jgi:uncharacterized protein (UPF0147 family)
MVVVSNTHWSIVLVEKLVTEVLVLREIINFIAVPRNITTVYYPKPD